jgi:nucleoside-diphosphate-sugar epimerase
MMRQVRDLGALDNAPHLLRLRDAHSERLHFVAVPNVALDTVEWADAVKGVHVVVHVANPVFRPDLSEKVRRGRARLHGPRSPRGAQDFVEISVNGVLNCMKHAHAAGVTRVVLTATMASVCGSARSLPGRAPPSCR